MVPIFKESTNPIEEVFQMHTDDTLESDYSLIDTEPLDINSKQELFTEDIHDTVYGTIEEFNMLFYDIENDLDTVIVSDEKMSDQASISQSIISTFMCTQQNTQTVCLAQVNGKVKRLWVKSLFKSESKVNPQFALDMPTYNKVTDIHSFYPTVIHATYLHSDPDSQDNPEIQLHLDGTLTASTPTCLPLHTLIDTSCYKTLLSKRFYSQNQKHFQNFYKVPFLEKHSITVGNGQIIFEHKMILLLL